MRPLNLLSRNAYSSVSCTVLDLHSDCFSFLVRNEAISIPYNTNTNTVQYLFSRPNALSQNAEHNSRGNNEVK